MKKKCLLASRMIVSMLILLISGAINAQDQAAISDSIYSNFLNEQRSIRVLLPASYKLESSDTYEVIYLTDGEWAMHPFSFIYKFAQDEHFVPPAIIVAIPNRYIDGANQRDRDLLPVHVPQPAISGGAGNFLNFIKDELMPYVDSKYPTNGTNSLYGHSYGGVFVLYVLLTEPQLFNTYYATDPPLRWNNDYLTNQVPERLSKLTTDKAFWIAGTSQNDNVAYLDSLLQQNASENLHWKTATYPNEKHNSVRLKAMYDGIKFANSGYSNESLVFHPMNGIVLKNKPVLIWVGNAFPECRYTIDGSEPDKTSPRIDESFQITGPTKLVVKSFSTNGRYDKTAKGNFELGKALPPLPKPGKIHAGGLKYTYYEGTWEKLPDFKKLKPVKTGIADNTFKMTDFPKKTGFACLFEGYLEITKDGYYIFVLVSKDGSKLFLGDKLLIDNDGVHSSESVKSFVLPLEKGFYPVRMEYFQKGKSGSMQVFYVEPGNEDTSPIPLDIQYHDE